MKAILVTLGVNRHPSEEWGAYGYTSCPNVYQRVKNILTPNDKIGKALPYVMIEVRDELSASCDNYKIYDIISRSMKLCSLKYQLDVESFKVNNKNDIAVSYAGPRHNPTLHLKTANAGSVVIDDENVSVIVIYPAMDNFDYVNWIEDHRGVLYRHNGLMTTKAIAAIPRIDEPRHHIDITTKILSFIKTIPVPSEVHTLDKFID